MEPNKKMITRLNKDGVATEVDYDQAVAAYEDDKFLRVTTNIWKVWLAINIAYGMFEFEIL